MDKKEAKEEFKETLNFLIDTQINSWRKGLTSTKESYPDIIVYQKDKFKYAIKLNIAGFMQGVVLTAFTFAEEENEEYSMGDEGPSNVKKFTSKLVDEREDDIEEMVDNVIGTINNDHSR